MSRKLSPEEDALWRRVTATVDGYHAQPGPPAAPAPPLRREARPGAGIARPGPTPPPAVAPGPRAETLDARWDRRLRDRATRPDRVIDLHGMRREEARACLHSAIARGAARGERLLLVVTGKGAAPGPAPADLMSGGAGSRGAIRADLPRWLGEAATSARVAAVRQAGPAHGGLGAVWIVLKRARPAGTTSK